MQEELKKSEAKSLVKRSSSPVGRASFVATKTWKIVEGLHSVRVDAFTYIAYVPIITGTCRRTPRCCAMLWKGWVWVVRVE